MNVTPHSVYRLGANLVLDARRAAWLPNERTLVVADLHLGFAWVQRRRGQLLPISAHDDTIDRLAALVSDYDCRELVLLGDIVHQAVAMPQLESELRRLQSEVGTRTKLVWVLGNHDRRLAALLARCQSNACLEREYRVADWLLRHGDEALPAAAKVQARSGPALMLGHFHPAVKLSDGLVSAMKVPCFLAGPKILVLPAFSSWAAGTPMCNGDLEECAGPTARIKTTIAICGNRLLPIPVQSRGGSHTV